MIVGIAWIGAFFYFIWLDNRLHPPLDPADAAKGIGGEVWRFMAAASTPPRVRARPRELPPELHWFKWEAYTTLINGLLLYWLLLRRGSGADRPVGDASRRRPKRSPSGSASWCWVGSSMTGSAARPSARTTPSWVACSMLDCAVSAWALCRSGLGPRRLDPFGRDAGHDHGLDVYYVIIPGQRELVKARKKAADRSKYGLMGRQRWSTTPVSTCRAVHDDQRPLCRAIRA